MTKNNWQQCKLADLCDSIDYGLTESASTVPFGPRFLRITDIVKGYIDWHSVPFCDVDKNLVEKYRLHDEDIVIARTGATTGVSAYISNPPDAIFASYLIRLKTNKKNNSCFISYFLKSPEYWSYMHGVLGDKSAQPNASAKTLTQANIRVPHLPEQKAIALILGALDDKIELNRKMNETLESMARALFKSWFVDFDPIPGLGPHKEWQDSSLGKIPKGWKTGIICEICENSRRGVNPEDLKPSTPYIGLEHMPRKNIALSEWGFTDNVVSNKFLFKKDDILFGKLRPYFHKVGVAAIDGVCSTDILVITPKESAWYGLALSHLSSDDFVNYADGTSTGTKMPRTNWTDMARFQIVIPPESIAGRFTDTVLPMVQTIQSNIHQSRILATVRDALLPKLLSGEIRVKDAVRFVEEKL